MRIIAHCPRPRRGGRLDRAAALRRALSSGAERIELDVLEADGWLLVAHDVDEDLSEAPSFAECLGAIAAQRRDLLADVKNAAAAAPLGDAIARAGYANKTIVSGELTLIQAVAQHCEATRAWTLPSNDPAVTPAGAGPLGIATPTAKLRVRRAGAQAIEARHCEAVSVDRRFVTRGLVDDVHAAGGRVIAWTVDRRSQLRPLVRLGVDEVVTDDPLGARRAVM